MQQMACGVGPDRAQRDAVLTAVKAGLPMQELVEAQERRPALTAAARDVPDALAGRDEEMALRSNKETDAKGRNCRCRSGIIPTALESNQCPRAGRN